MSDVLYEVIGSTVYVPDDIEDHLYIVQEKVYDELYETAKKLWEE